MKTFEPIYKELEYLLIKKLPDNIEKINMEHNDGIILKSFENTTLEENCIKTPSFVFNIEETEYSEKDRIIENEVYKISIEIKMHPNTKQKTIIFYRYIEAIQLMLNEESADNLYTIEGIQDKKLYIRIVTAV